MDRYRIDNHKLMFHVDRVKAWLDGELVAPIYMELSPIGSCNHRCIFCGLDFMGYQRRSLDATLLEERFSEMASMGLRSIMHAGEGEPLLHRDIARIITHAKRVGIDNALTTNAVLLKPELCEQVLAHLTWIKVSINAGTANTYAAIHQTKPSDFEKVLSNMAHAVRIKQQHKLHCTLGMQLILLPENQAEVPLLAQQAQDLGLDYLVVKPYSQHPQSETKRYQDIRYEQTKALEKELNRLSTDSFQVIFRAQTMHNWDLAQRSYQRCLALPFWSYIDSAGDVWGCSVYLGDRRFYYGNIQRQSFRDIWHGEQRLKSLRFVSDELDPCTCRVNCRMDAINRYLWELKNPSEHINFI